MNLKELFSLENDEQADKVGEELIKQLNLHKSPDHDDRWIVSGSTFTKRGVARRIARIFIESKK